jgi:NAD(P)-dependent dehydrogenase (short-subunit alcohol dehydrogenase family)
VRAVFETNVFGVVAVTQAMLPLLRDAPAARIVNVSSDVGSLGLNADPSFPYRSAFSVGYAASKTALNAVTLALAVQLESAGIKVNAASPGYTATVLDDFEGAETVSASPPPVSSAARGPEQKPSGGRFHGCPRPEALSPSPFGRPLSASTRPACCVVDSGS